MENPRIDKMALYEVIRHKLGPYATDIWFDSEYLATPAHERPSFLSAFKRKWIRMMDNDDFNKLIQGYKFYYQLDAVQLGLKFEEDVRPYLKLAQNETVREMAELAKVARFRKVLGGPLMAQLIQRHPRPFRSVNEMINEIKDLNDELGITHRVQPAETAFSVMTINNQGNYGNLNQGYNNGRNNQNRSHDWIGASFLRRTIRRRRRWRRYTSNSQWLSID